MLPIDELYVPDAGRQIKTADLRRRFDNRAPASLASRLRDLVQQEVEAHSKEILAD